MTPKQVIEMLAKHIVGRYPCPSGVIAQLILEVGFNLKTPKDMVTGRESYNIGNIKGVGTAGSVTILTTEYYTPAQVEKAKKSGTLVKVIGNVNGKVKVLVKDKFRAYNNYAEAITDHFTLLKNKRYVNAGVWEAKTPHEFASALKRGGYATDPSYVSKITKIVEKFNLTQFDNSLDHKLKITPPVSPKEEDAFMQFIMSEQGKKYAKEAIDSLSKKGFLNSPEDWKKRVDSGEIYQELPWMTLVLLDRISNKQK